MVTRGDIRSMGRNDGSRSPVVSDMDTDVGDALEASSVCDITTVGAKSGDPHRIEIYYHHLDGEFFITGRPGTPRDWLANLKANPEFILHLKHGIRADLRAKATEITDPEERSRVLFRIRTRSWDVPEEKVRATNQAWVEGSPLVRFTVDGVSVK